MKKAKPVHVHCACGGVCRTFGERGAADRHRALHYARERLHDGDVQRSTGKAPDPHPYPTVTPTCPEAGALESAAAGQ